MAAHYCINCPRCRRGCSICRRCACTDAELDEAFKQHYTPFQPLQPMVTPLVPAPDEDQQKPETD